MKTWNHGIIGPFKAYCNNSSSPLHPVQQKLIEETVQHNRSVTRDPSKPK